MGILEISGLCKRFGDHPVLTGLDMDIPEHSIFGFVGQNGAGKTTTMKIILGLLKADSGSVTVCGDTVSYGQTKTNRNIGFLPDVPEFYGYMKPMEYLKLCGDITGLDAAQTKAKSEELLALVGLKDENEKIGGFSRGMKQRLGIAQALINEPKLLICDEPTSALDPIGRKEILDILCKIKGKSTVLFSTHILSDVEKICDNIAVLHNGKLALCGPLSEAKSKYRRSGFVVEFAKEEESSAFEGLEELKKPGFNISREKSTVTVLASDVDSAGYFLLDLLVKKHMVPLRFADIEPTLENLFAEVVK